MLRFSHDVLERDQSKSKRVERWATQNRGTHSAVSADGQPSSIGQRAHAKQPKA